MIEKAVEVFDNKTKKIPTSKLNDALLPEIIHYPPPSIKGKHIQIKYITQVNAATQRLHSSVTSRSISRSLISASWRINSGRTLILQGFRFDSFSGRNNMPMGR